MTNLAVLGAFSVLVICGCPTRTIYYDAGVDATGEGTGGHSGEAGSKRSGGAPGASSGGQSGIVGNEGRGGGAQGGAGGAAEGDGGVLGQRGAAGAGGGSGQAGAAAIGGSAGSTSTKSKDGEHCALASDCASAACTPFYADLDGDGSGAGQAVGFCGVTAPVGYAVQSGDCCDTATNLAIAKLIHPGADFQTTSAGGVCNITWDYDCSGAVEKSWQTCGSCNAAPDCSCVYVDFPDSDCGTMQAGVSCLLIQAGPSESCTRMAGGTGPVTCR